MRENRSVDKRYPSVSDTNFSEVLFASRGGIGEVTLNRPAALNAVTLEMLRALDDRLVAWMRDDAIGLVVISGEGRAFAAGGDIRRLYDAGKAGDSYTSTFFWDEYVTDWRVFHYPKPYVAIMDGVTMGGGVGLSVHGTHRVVTENTVFAMPETGIGFFPDVGGTYFLPRLPGRIGLYMALTGARLRAADCLYAGIATHYVPADRLEDLKRALADAGLADSADAHGRVGEVLGRFATGPGEAPIAALRERIDTTFDAEGVEEVAAKLSAAGDDWAEKTLSAMLARSPTALKVAFEQVRRGAGLSFDECLTLEYRISQAFMRGHDFFEGVRATIVDKDGRPKWRPDRLEDVLPTDVERYFERPSEGDLQFNPPRRRDQIDG